MGIKNSQIRFSQSNTDGPFYELQASAEAGEIFLSVWSLFYRSIKNTLIKTGAYYPVNIN